MRRLGEARLAAGLPCVLFTWEGGVEDEDSPLASGHGIWSAPDDQPALFQGSLLDGERAEVDGQASGDDEHPPLDPGGLRLDPGERAEENLLPV